ncbi:MAG: MmgE/PrpD family protein [Candidatus Rokubacteria bacterium]|nr:MmgE/PrpD family protein [Candidatus Rokubacteria bacterium]
MGATVRLAEFVVKTRWEELPPAAIDAAKRAILDSVGVILAGSGEPPARLLQRIAEEEGGAPLCTVLGTQLRTGAVWAALANGTAGHALDFDDTNFALLGHPSVPVFAAALAAAELSHADGRAVIQAFLIGFEVETTLAEAMNPAHYARGWHATSTLGTLGALAASAKLLGLGPVESRNAFAIAASEASGLKENFGTMTKPFHAGHAARSGVLAALLAREGFTGSEIALEGPQGYLRVFGSQAEDPAPALGRLGSPWKILATGVAVKPYPSCACTHSIITALLELRRTHSLQAEDVAEVTLGVNELVPHMLIHHNPRTGLEGKFSAEFCAALALVDGQVGIASFQDERTADPTLRSLMGRVTMVVDPTIPGNLEHHVWCRVTVRLRDGRELEVPPREVPGHPRAPLSGEQLLAKFTDCAGRVLPRERVESIAEMLEGLDGCPDLRSLTAVLRP